MKEDSYIKLYTIVPSSIYKTKKLTSEEKLIAERIVALCQKKGRAWVSNKYLSEMYGIREDTVSKHISKLKNYGFIKCNYGKRNNDDKLARVIYLSDDIWNKHHNQNSLNNKKDNGHSFNYNNKDNSNYNKKINIVPEWLKNPELCQSKPCTKEEQQELEDLLKEFK